MIVVDTSAFISLDIADVLEAVLREYEVHTTQRVVDELSQTAKFDDDHGTAAENVLPHVHNIAVHELDDLQVRTSRIDPGKGSCLQLTGELDADFLITDDLRALPELQQLTGARIAISPIMLRALVNRGILSNHEAMEKLETLAVTRDWLGAPIYRRAKSLFEN